MTDLISSKLKKRALAAAVASCLTVAPWLAHAAGLGKITVLSGLGQPLRAELEVTASREEFESMAARLAPQDAFKQVGIEYAPVLADLRFSAEKRPGGKHVIKVTSAKAINEPFLDFLVEVNWSSGRLVREYTFLLDPPEMLVKSSGRPVSVVEAKVVQTVPGGGAVAEAEPVRSPSRPAPAATPAPAPVPRAAPETPKQEPGETRVVKAGDTLGKIAAATQHQGVSLEQMLVGLYKNNPEAFAGQNLNRLKSGAILAIPTKEMVEAIPEPEAKKIFLAQAADWGTYRQKLAAAASGPAREDSAKQQVSGKITPKVEDKTLPAEQGKDQVKVSRNDAASVPAAATGFAEEDRIAKDKALREAQERLALLEKNINELQKLVELKNQSLAELQQQNAAKAAEMAKPPAAEPVAPPVKADEAPKVPEAAKPPVEEVKPLPEPKKPVPPKAPPPVEVPPPVQPDLLDSLLADPVPLAGAGGILALLLGYFAYSRRRKAQPAQTTAAGFAASSLGPQSVFGVTGGQNVDTSNTVPHSSDFSQTGPGTIDTGEVDPVAEADVYMAYGRDAQAEEILVEALQKDPQRTAIHAKLLEIYANRRSVKQFETLAGELYAQTAGMGGDWEKVAALGAQLDPANPLYSGSPNSVRTAASVPNAGEALVAASESVPAPAVGDELSFELPDAESAAEQESVEREHDFTSTVVTDYSLGESYGEDAGHSPVTAGDLPASDEPVGLDFDLGASVIRSPAQPEREAVVATLPEQGLGIDQIDFDLGTNVAPVVPSEPETVPSAQDFSEDATLIMSQPFHLAMESDRLEDIEAIDVAEITLQAEEEPALPQIVPEPPRGAPAEAAKAMAPLAEEPPLDLPDLDAMEFDMTLTDSTVLGQPAVSAFDIGSISLDLAADEMALESSVTGDEAVPLPAAEAVVSGMIPAQQDAGADVAVDDALREEITTKLDLAKAYEEMGDLEGARELLGEVAAEGPADLANEAKEILARIGG